VSGIGFSFPELHDRGDGFTFPMAVHPGSLPPLPRELWCRQGCGKVITFALTDSFFYVIAHHV
jgi:hypothetical protein